MTLNPKQERFCLEYLADLNATQAAIRAGYSAKTAYSQGQRLLKNVEVAPRLTQLVTERNGRLKVDGDWVLRRLVELADVDLADLYGDGGELLDLREMPEDAKRLLAGLDMTEEFEGRGPDRRHVGRTKKLRLVDRLKVLELIGKHVDVSAFKENERAGEPLVIIRDYTGRIINNANDATPPLADKKPASLPAPAPVLPADPDTSNETPDAEVDNPAPASTASAREPKKVEIWSIQRPGRGERQGQAEM